MGELQPGSVRNDRLHQLNDKRKMKTNLKRITPGWLWGAARDVQIGLAHAWQWPASALHPWRAASIRRLAELKDVHRGQRCFIIGNGPSLQQTDLPRLNGEYTFGMNRFYLAFSELGFTTSYYLSINSLVIEQCAEEIRALPIPKFLSWRSRSWFPPTDDTIYLHTTYAGPRFARDARQRLWEGATVTYIALQLTFHMGFEQAILIGVDHNFNTKGKPNTTVVSQGDDLDHFHTGYFGKGFRWQLPDLETSEQSYRMAHQAYLQAGREILDATVGGKLNVFPKVDYDGLFG
jgi:hypothetical protein